MGEKPGWGGRRGAGGEKVGFRRGERGEGMVDARPGRGGKVEGKGKFIYVIDWLAGRMFLIDER